jgi:outer membrane receptor protein involved in Fe transport
MSGRRLELMLDVYNVFNASPILSTNNTYGQAWQRPNQILDGRLFKFGVQLDF